jgi:hypothetical protein
MLVAIPSRERPEQLRTAISEGLRLANGAVYYHVAVDDDDPRLDDYTDLLESLSRDGHVSWEQGPRKSLVEWTNWIAKTHLERYLTIASFGDDHVPETLDWDTMLLGPLEEIGGTGFAYPDDIRRQDIPEAVVITTDIIRTLGWMCLPDLHHFYPDVVWRDLGSATGTLYFAEDVIVRHHHYLVDKTVSRDATYGDAEEWLWLDEQTYKKWKWLGGMAADVRKIRTLLQEKI